MSWKKVSGVVCDRKLSAKAKGKMYQSVVRPAMLYGMETVAMTEKQVGKMEVAELKMVKWALGVTTKDKIKNEYVSGTEKIAKLGDKVKVYLFCYIGLNQPQNQENVKAHRQSYVQTGSCEGTFRSSSRAATLVIYRVLDEFTASAG